MSGWPFFGSGRGRVEKIFFSGSGWVGVFFGLNDFYPNSFSKHPLQEKNNFLIKIRNLGTDFEHLLWWKQLIYYTKMNECFMFIHWKPAKNIVLCFWLITLKTPINSSLIFFSSFRVTVGRVGLKKFFFSGSQFGLENMPTRHALVSKKNSSKYGYLT